MEQNVAQAYADSGIVMPVGWGYNSSACSSNLVERSSPASKRALDDLVDSTSEDNPIHPRQIIRSVRPPPTIQVRNTIALEKAINSSIQSIGPYHRNLMNLVDDMKAKADALKTEVAEVAKNELATSRNSTACLPRVVERSSSASKQALVVGMEELQLDPLYPPSMLKVHSHLICFDNSAYMHRYETHVICFLHVLQSPEQVEVVTVSEIEDQLVRMIGIAAVTRQRALGIAAAPRIRSGNAPGPSDVADANSTQAAPRGPDPVPINLITRFGQDLSAAKYLPEVRARVWRGKSAAQYTQPATYPSLEHGTQAAPHPSTGAERHVSVFARSVFGAPLEHGTHGGGEAEDDAAGTGSALSVTPIAPVSAAAVTTADVDPSMPDLIEYDGRPVFYTVESMIEDSMSAASAIDSRQLSHTVYDSSMCLVNGDEEEREDLSLCFNSTACRKKTGFSGLLALGFLFGFYRKKLGLYLISCLGLKTRFFPSSFGFVWVCCRFYFFWVRSCSTECRNGIRLREVSPRPAPGPVEESSEPDAGRCPGQL